MSPLTSLPSTKKHCEPGVWPGRVDERDRDRADLDDVARRVQREVGVGAAGDALDAPRFVRLHVQLGVDVGEREQLGDAGDRPTAEVTTDVVGVVVRDEHTREMHAVGGEDVDELGRAVRGIDRDRVAGLAVADEVDEVDHLARDLVVGGEVAAGQAAGGSRSGRPSGDTLEADPAWERVRGRRLRLAACSARRRRSSTSAGPRAMCCARSTI